MPTPTATPRSNPFTQTDSAARRTGSRGRFVARWLVVALALAWPALARADWALPPGQEAAVERAVRAAFPELADPAIAIRGAAIELRLDAGVVHLERGENGNLRLRADAATLPADALAAAQARLDAAAIALDWQEVQPPMPNAAPSAGHGAAPDVPPSGEAAAAAAAAGARPAAEAPAAPAPADAVEAAGRGLADALDLERRAAHGRDAVREAAIAAVSALPEATRPEWMDIDAALLQRAGGADAPGRARAAAAADRLTRADAVPGADAAARAALRVRALAVAGQDDAAVAAAAQAPAPRCAVAALLERDAVLRDDAALARDAERLLATHADCAELAAPLVAAMRRRGDAAGTLPLLERIAAARPEDGFVARQLAYAHARLGHPDAVFPLLDRVIAAGGLNDSELVDVSHIATVVQAPDAWIASLEQRAAAKPDDADLAFLLGVVLHYRGRWADSDAALARAEARHGRIARLLIYRAMNHHRLGDDERAAPFIERAAALGAEDPDVLYCRAVIFLDRDAAGAKRDLQAYLERTSGTAEVNPGKQARVRKMLVDLQDCESARSPRACLEQKALLRLFVPSAVGGVLLALLAIFLWRRYRRGGAALLVAGLLASSVVASPGPAQAQTAASSAAAKVRTSAGYALWNDAERPPPRALVAQLSWLDRDDAVQVAVASGLWGAVAVAFFFCCRPGFDPHSPR